MEQVMKFLRVLITSRRRNENTNQQICGSVADVQRCVEDLNKKTKTSIYKTYVKLIMTYTKHKAAIKNKWNESTANNIGKNLL